MPHSVFVSYSHEQGEWVRDRLVPLLRGAGAQVKVDWERFKAGLALFPQMDGLQDEAERSILVLSPDYLASAPCQHEMARAIAKDPAFRGPESALPLVRLGCTLPPEIKRPDPIWIDFEDDRRREPWKRLLAACEGSVGCEGLDWLEAFAETRQLLERHESVNLVVGEGVAWRQLLEELQANGLGDLGVVDLQPGRVAARDGLVAEILRVLGSKVPVPPPPRDLGVLDRHVSSRSRCRLALTHVDLVAHRHGEYGVDLFSSLRDLVTERKKLTLLAVSRTHLAELLPPGHPLSAFGHKTVELRGRR